MRVLILHNRPQTERPDDLDTLMQVHEIEGALHGLGHVTARQGISDDLAVIDQAITDFAADRVFNCVEEFKNSSYFNEEVVNALASSSASFTGSGVLAHHLCACKIRMKQALKKADLPTAAYKAEEEINKVPENLKYIVKSQYEHASLGMDEKSVVMGAKNLAKLINEKKALYGGKWFAERYIEGREFNVALIGPKHAPTALPINEITFVNFTEEQARIVDYHAKWNERSTHYHNTQRRLMNTDNEPLLARYLIDLSMQCWTLFELNGYARVDYRVDKQGIPWILEVNTNPCLSKDAGFIASAKEAKLSHEAVIENILAHCIGGV